MMDQTHIGYTYWQQPEYNSMPAVNRIKVASGSMMGVAIEGSERWWPNEKRKAELPGFDRHNQQSYYIEIFNRGNDPFKYTARPAKSWLKLSSSKGTMEKQERIVVSIDWKKAPIGKYRIPINIVGPNRTRVRVYAIINNPLSPKPADLNGFVESNGYVSIEAEDYSKAIGSERVQWLRIPDLGRTKSALTTIPVTDSIPSPSRSTPHLEYRIYFFTSDTIKVKTYLSPTSNFHNTQGLRYAISFDYETPQVINMHARSGNQAWEERVANNINICESEHIIKKPGSHTLKYWLVDAGIVVQKFVIEPGKVKPSYLGPPESFYNMKKANKGK
jgi:hypothetical protein